MLSYLLMRRFLRAIGEGSGGGCSVLAHGSKRKAKGARGWETKLVFQGVNVVQPQEYSLRKQKSHCLAGLTKKLPVGVSIPIRVALAGLSKTLTAG